MSTWDSTKHPRGQDPRNRGRFAEVARNEIDLEDLEDVDGHQLMDAANRAVAVARFEGDAAYGREDMAQDTAIALLEQRRRYAASVTDGVGNGETTSEEAIDAAVGRFTREQGSAVAVVRRAANRIYTQDPHLRDAEGHRRMARWEMEFTEKNRREPSAAERDAAAEKIRLEIPETRRPRVGFHNRRRFSEVGLTVTGSDGHEYERRTSALVFNHDFYDSGDAGESHLTDDDVDDFLESGIDKSLSGRDQKREMTRVAFVTFAEGFDAAKPQEHSISESVATRMRRRAAEVGGARELWRQFEAGRLPDADTRALEQVFGDCTTDEVARVGVMFKSHPDYADGLFSSALAYATRFSSRKRLGTL